MWDNVVGQVLREYRKSKGLTQEQLSGLAVLDRTHYSKVERGLRSPTLETIFKLAYALDIPAYEIIKTIEEKLEVDGSTDSDFRFKLKEDK